MTNEEAIKIIKSECYTANLLNLDRTRMVNTALDLAIKALEQQPCDDCISREAVLDTECQIKEINGIEYVMLSEVQMKIRKMPSVIPKYTDEEIDKAQLVEQAYVDKMVELAVEELKTPKTEWIPVNERLPEKAGKYLVTVKNGNVYAGVYDAFSGQFQCAATAWMPLPQPYNAESEG